MKSVVVIPARHGSQRFPGKVLADLGGKPVIQWVYEKARSSVADRVVVATDDQRVVAAAAAFGAEAALTSPDHASGTDRVWEVAEPLNVDVVVNVQGDEPFIPPEMIDRLIAATAESSAADVVTAAVACPRSRLSENPNIVKVVFDNDNYALYFSRSMIPALREGGEEAIAYKHWGVYAFKKEVLRRFVSLPPGRYECCERLEQLRALEDGMRIRVLISDRDVVGIDTLEDLEEARREIRQTT